MKKTVVLWVVLLCSLSFSQSYHADYKTVNIHSAFRWIVADSAARVALTVTTRDTQKLCFQTADTTIWLLSDNSPVIWTWVSGKKVDSLYVSKGVKVTRATIDSSKTRIANADSVTIPVFKGIETHRDSSYFVSGLRAARFYTPVANVDSMTGSWSKTGYFIATWTGLNVAATDTVYYTKVGKHVTLTFTPFAGTMTSGVLYFAATQMPVDIRPTRRFVSTVHTECLTGDVSSPVLPHMTYNVGNMFLNSFTNGVPMSVDISFNVTYFIY